MSTVNENTDSRFIIQDRDGFFSGIISWKSNVVERMKQVTNDLQIQKMVLDSVSMNAVKWNEFVRHAEELGFTVYQLVKEPAGEGAGTK